MEEIRSKVEARVPGVSDRTGAIDGGPDRRPDRGAATGADQDLLRRPDHAQHDRPERGGCDRQGPGRGGCERRHQSRRRRARTAYPCRMRRRPKAWTRKASRRPSRTWCEGNVATQFQTGPKTIGIRVRVAGALALTDTQLGQLQIRAPDGHLFALDRVAERVTVTGPAGSEPRQPQAHGGGDGAYRRPRSGLDHCRRAEGARDRQSAALPACTTSSAVCINSSRSPSRV